MYAHLNLAEGLVAVEGALFGAYMLGVVLHEAGHAAMAMLMRLDVRMVSVGRGPAVLRARWSGVAYVLHALPMSGFVAIAARPGMSRRRYAAMIAAGPAVNLMLLVLAIWLDETLPYYDAVLMPAAMAQAILLLLTLAPFRHRARAGLRASDGLQLWTQLVRRPPDMFTTNYAAVMAQVFAEGQRLPPPSDDAPDLLYQVLRSDRAFDPWATRDAATAVRALLDARRLTPAERAVGLEFLASVEVLFGGTRASVDDLDAWSAEACALATGVATTLTRAGVLATTGRAEQAMDLLLALPETERPTVVAFRYWLHMGQAGAARGWTETAQTSLAKARAAATVKGAQRRVLQRILARAERLPPLVAVDPARRTAISAA